MDTLEQDRRIIEAILSELAAIPYSFSDVPREAIFDRSHDNYLLLINGWEGWKHIHGVIVHVDIINGKFWIHRDGTEGGSRRNLWRQESRRSASYWPFVRRPSDSTPSSPSYNRQRRL